MKTKKWPTGGAGKTNPTVCRRHAHGRTSSGDEMMDNKRLISALFVLQNLQLEC